MLFFFNDTATTEIYTLSLHDALPISKLVGVISDTHGLLRPEAVEALKGSELIVHAGDIGGPEIIEALRAIAPVVAVRGNKDRKSTRLNSSHANISYAVFCLKTKYNEQ